MNIEDIKQADLQKATLDINKVLELGPELKQKHIAGRQVLIDFIITTIDGCIGPDPENEGQEIWTNPLAANLAQETQDIYLALTAGRNGGEPEAAEAAVEAQAPEVAAAEAAGQPDPAAVPEPEQECEDFGKAYDPNDPACAQGGPEGGPCAKADECAQLTSKHLKDQKQKKVDPSGGGDKKDKGPSARGTMLDLLCGDPAMPKEKLVKAIAEAGFKEGEHFKKATLDTVFSDCQQVFNRLRKSGHLAE